ncbi:MAG: hypothetical protein HYU43_00835 [Armatimonadetes bacterium]|nr:hypothetical protein [Planctomycetota bacterium]MBI2200472.1 hypothetical protein [Armatimonadota bacterium]
MSEPGGRTFHERLMKVDRRLVYLFVLLALTVPLLSDFGMHPARMETAQMAFDTVEGLPAGDGKMAWLAMDWGPSTRAENEPQTQVVMEHLMRRRIPFCTFSITYQAEPFMNSLPEKVAADLNRENEAQGVAYRYEYGKDWCNIGYRPAATLFVRGLAKTKDVAGYIGVDARGTPVREIPCMSPVRTVRDFSLLAEFTGLVGAFQIWVQFFQTEDYVPKFIHGCTSITIPEAFIYLDSKQIQGLFEGVAGAAYYSKLIKGDRFDPVGHPDLATKFMMSLSLAHLVILGLIVVGNVGLWLQARAAKAKRGEGGRP